MPLLMISLGVHNIYSHNKSSTYQVNGEPISLEFGPSAISGYLSQDNVNVSSLYSQELACFKFLVQCCHHLDLMPG